MSPLIVCTETYTRGDTMDLTVKRSGIACCEKIFEYSMPVEEASETVVPDVMPDADRILCADGAVVIRSKDVSDGRVSVAGTVLATVLYAPDGESGICTLGATVPINVEVDAPEVTNESLAVAMMTVGSVEARLMNPRKILVRAVVNVSIECYKCTELDISTGLEGEGSESVETLCESATISPVVCVKEKTFVVSDEYRLQPGLLPIGAVLWHSAEIIPGNVRSVGSRLVFNGTVRLAVLYEAAGSSELCSANFETEFSQMLDAETDLSSPDCTVSSMLTAEYVEVVTLTGGEKGISAEFHLVSQCVCTDSVRVQCLTDCYSNAGELNIGRSQTDMSCVQRRSTVRASIHETLPASPQPVNICRVICRTGAVESEGGMLCCPVSVTAIYTASDGAVYSVSRRLTCEAPSELGEGEYAASVRSSCAECGWTLSQGGIDVRVALDFELVSARRTTFSQITIVESAGDVQEKDWPSIVVIRASDTDSLWDLGKRYHSTSALISDMNGLEDGESLAGKVLLIPRG